MPESVLALERELEDQDLGDTPIQDLGTKHMLQLLLRNQILMIEESRKRERKQYVLNQKLQRDIDRLHRKLDARDPAMGPATFPQFRLLPAEVRQRIWQLAIPSQLFTHVDLDVAEPKTFDRSIVRAPAVNEVCSESRAVAARLGRYHAVGGHSQSTRARWSWFSPYSDILLLGWNTRRTPSAEHVAKRVFFECAEALGQSAPPVWTVSGELSQLDHYRQLEEVCIGPRYVIDKKSSPSLASELFCGDSARLIYLDDALAVQRVIALLRQEWALDHGVSSAALCQYILRGFPRHGGNFDEEISTIQKYVVERRALAMIEAETLADGETSYIVDGVANMEVPWVREFLNSFAIKACSK